MKKESIKDIVDHIIADGKITKSEQKCLTAAILKDGKVDPEEREQIDRLFEMIHRGEISAVP